MQRLAAGVPVGHPVAVVVARLVLLTGGRGDAHEVVATVRGGGPGELLGPRLGRDLFDGRVDGVAAAVDGLVLPPDAVQAADVQAGADVLYPDEVPLLVDCFCNAKPSAGGTAVASPRIRG